MTGGLAMGRRGPALLPAVLTFELTAAGVYPQPFVLGYVDAAQLPTADDVQETRAAISQYAVAEKLALGNVYVDYPGLGGSSFRALLIAVQRYNPLQVLVPSLDHVDDHSPGGRLEILLHTTVAVRPLDGNRR